jgi:hypothetical protein
VKDRVVYILETWLRRIHIWGDGLQASDPRDLIFSLCSMTYWKEDYGVVKPNYKKSVRDVHIELAKHFLESGCSGLLAWRNPSEGDDDEVFGNLRLPTFVPDWRRPIRPVYLVKLHPLEGNTELQFEAGDNLPGKGELKPVNGDPVVRLQVGAYIIDTICSVGPLHEERKDSIPDNLCPEMDQAPALMYALREQASKKESTVPFGSRLLQAKHVRQLVAQNLWKIPILDAEIIESDLKRASADFEGEMQYLLNANEGRTLGEEIEMPRRYSNIATEVCVEKRFYVTENGFAGIGYKTIRPGYQVIVIPGLRVPLIVDVGWAPYANKDYGWNQGNAYLYYDDADFD